MYSLIEKDVNKKPLYIMITKINMREYVNFIQTRTDLTLQILKVGTWSFEGIIILLICFLNCRKVLFTKN